MKKVICFVLLMHAVVLGTVAQQLGELVVFDGVPAFIFYLDETGQHGKAMFCMGSLVKMPKDQRKTLMTRLDAIDSKINSKQGTQVPKNILVDLVGRLTDDGKTNQEQIVSFCNERNISLQEAFPMQYYAQKLGSDWYIPGDKELAEFADFYCGGLKKKFHEGINPLSRPKKLNPDPVVYYSIFVISRGCWSSSCHSADSGFRVLINMQSGLSNLTWGAGKHNWLEIVDDITNKYGASKKGNFAAGIVAVHDF